MRNFNTALLLLGICGQINASLLERRQENVAISFSASNRSPAAQITPGASAPAGGLSPFPSTTAGVVAGSRPTGEAGVPQQQPSPTPLSPQQPQGPANAQQPRPATLSPQPPAPGAISPQQPPAAPPGQQAPGIISEQRLMTAGIVGGAKPTGMLAAAGTGAVLGGVPQPAAIMNPQPVNSATVKVAGIVNPTPGVQQPGVAAPTGFASAPGAVIPAGVDVATLKTAGILASGQPTSPGTAGVPQPAAQSGTPAVDSATLRTAGLVGGATGAAGVATGTGQLGQPANTALPSGQVGEADSGAEIDAWGKLLAVAASVFLIL